MNISPFKLEAYYERYEFKTRYMLSSSDPESWSLGEILAMANQQDRLLWEQQRFGYTEVRGLPLLRELIAESFYPELTAENILCFAGAEEGIFCSLLTLCTPQDHVVVLTPCYQSLLEIPTMAGAQVTALPLKEEEQWHINLEAITAALRPNTKAVVINFPHNPTGQVITQEELSALIDLLEKRGIWLFSDEVYRLLGTVQSWATPAACLYSRALSLGVMSKIFGMPGLRIGWIASQDKELLDRITRMKHYTSLCNSGPAEILSVIGLRNKDRLLERNNKVVADNLALLDTFFQKHADLFSWVRPQGGCTGFVHYLEKERVDDLCMRVMKEAEVLLLPGSTYDVASNHFRIGFGRKNMPEALARFERVVEGRRMQ